MNDIKFDILNKPKEAQSELDIIMQAHIDSGMFTKEQLAEMRKAEANRLKEAKAAKVANKKEVTNTQPVDTSLELPKVTEEDVKVTEGEAVKRLKSRFGGLGFTFKQAVPGGDYITIIAPPGENGEKTEETFSFDKGVLGGDIAFGRLLGGTSITKETEDINKFIQDHYRKGEIQNGVDAKLYSETMKYVNSKPISFKNKDGSVKEMKDLTSQELEQHQQEAFNDMFENKNVWGDVIGDINSELEAYTKEQTSIISKKYDLTSEDGVLEANKELEKLVRKKNEKLINDSPEYEKLVRSINAAVTSRYGSKDMEGSLINRKYFLEAEKEFLPVAAAIRKIPLIGDGWADASHGVGVGRFQIAKGFGETTDVIEMERVLKHEKSELSDLQQRVKDGASLDEEHVMRRSGRAFGSVGESIVYEGTIGHRIEVLKMAIPEYLRRIQEGVVSSEQYQKKISALDPAEIFDKSMFDPHLTTDEFQKMVGTQATQMVAGIFMYPTFAQEAGGIAMESSLIEAARKTFPNLDDEKAKQAFSQLPDKTRTRLITQVITNGEVDFDPAVNFGAAAASLDVVSNFVVFGQAVKGIPTSVLRDAAKLKFKKILTSKGAKAVYGTTGLETVTEALQEKLGVEGVEAATGYGGIPEENVKRMLEGAGQAFLTTPFLTASGKVSTTGIKEFKARVFANPKQARTLINKEKAKYKMLFEDGVLTEQEKDDIFTELEAVEDMVNNVDKYKKMDSESKEITIQNLAQVKRVERQKLQLESENKKIKKERVGGLGNLETLQNENKIKDLQAELDVYQQEVIKELLVSNYFQDGRIAEWINMSQEGDFKNKKFKRFENKEQANEYFSKLFEDKGWLGYAQRLSERVEEYQNKGLSVKEAKEKAFEDFNTVGDATKLQSILDVKRLYDGDVNAAVQGNTAWVIDENVVANIRKGDPTSTNAFHHEGFHWIQSNMSKDKLKEIKEAIEKELSETTDPKLLRLYVLQLDLFSKRYEGKYSKDSKEYYDEWFSNLSDAMKYFSAIDLNENSSQTLFNIGKMFGGVFKKQTQLGLDFSKFDAGNALDYIKKWNGFQGVSSGVTVRMPKGKINTEQEDKKEEEGGVLTSEVYQEINETFQDYVDLDKQLAANVTADMMQGIVFDRLKKLKDAGLIEGFDTKDLEDIQLQFTGPIENIPKKIKNRGAVGLLMKFEKDFKGGVMGYFNATIRGRKMLDMRLQEFVENHPKYGNIQVSLQQEGVTTAVDAQQTALSPEEIMIQKEQAKLTDLDRTLNEGKAPKTDILKTGKKDTRQEILNIVTLKKGDTFTQVLDIKNIYGNTGKVSEMIFNVPAKKILDRNEDGKAISANLTYAKKITDGIPEPSEAGNIQDYYANEQAIVSEIKTLPKTNVASKDAEVNKDGDKVKVSRETLGKAVGLSNSVLNYFYNKKFKPDGKRARSQGLTSQVALWEIKDEFINPSSKTIKKAQKEFFGITPVGQLNVYNRVIGQNLKGFAKHTAGKKALSAAARKSDDTQQVADIRAGISNVTAFSETVDGYMDGYGNVELNFEIEQKIINAVLNHHLGIKMHTYKTQKDIDNLIVDIKKHVIPILPGNVLTYNTFVPSDRHLGKTKKDIIVVEGKEMTIKEYYVQEMKKLTYDGNKIGKGKPFNGAGAKYKQGVTYATQFGLDAKDIKQTIVKGRKISGTAKNPVIMTAEQINAMNMSMHEQMWERINKSIKDTNGKSAKVWANWFSTVANNTEHPHRMGAEFLGFSTNPKGYTNPKSGNFKLYEWEHAMPASRAYNYLMHSILSGLKESKNFKDYSFAGSYVLIQNNYKLIALDKNDDEVKLKGAGHQTSMGVGWNLSDLWLDRYFADVVAEIEGGIDPKGIEHINGKTFDKVYNVSSRGAVSAKIKQNIGKNKRLNNAIVKARTSKFSETSRGITVLDFDDTLATSKSLVISTSPEGTVRKLTAEEFAQEGADLLDQGWVHDFSEFSKVVKGKVASLFNKAIKLQGKFGPENMFVLTARPANSAPAIFEFLQANGLNIPLKNITGLANSTAEAKALWIADKVADGYNDFYFADDALQNVQAVQNMLDQFDVKSKVQQAKVKFSESMSNEFNNILDDVTGVESQKVFSEAQAKIRGQKSKYKSIIPPSAQDFAGLLYNFLGKGKKGEKQMAFFKKALIDPFARAINELNAARQASANDYENLLKQFPKVKKLLNKKIEGTDYTHDQAARIYLWNKAGFDIPGLSKRDLKTVLDFVENNSDIKSFAESVGLISKKEDGYSAPGDYWLAENIKSDLLSDGSIGDARSEFLAEWQQNADIIFSPENLNKIEAIYGSNFREALEDILYRMKTGRNRPTGGGRLMNIYTNWVNNSVGAIMFFNMRSALLQTISATNYINWSDNNPLKAAAAFANQKQYWKDFSYLFNSDYLKQRRAGNQRGVNEAELSAAVAGAENKAKAAITWLLKKGFLPTQIADSFAIASGGATFYRNRIKALVKEGMTQEQAEKQAFLDFQETTEVAQQSARPDMISQQQASPLGKLILAFQNTPMQYARIMNKAARDLVNGRGDSKTHMSKIIYYGFVQSIIFGALQSALFASLDDEDEERFDKKKERILNGMVDSVLSGIGYGGKAVSTMKNTLITFLDQRKRGFNADHTYTILQLLGFSPPIGSKLRKVYSSIQTDKFNKDVFLRRGFTLDNPIWSAVGNVVEGVTNVPLGRLSQKMLNIDNALDANNEWWQRVALVLGWNTWDLGIKDADIEGIKTDIKKKKKKNKIKTKNTKNESVNRRKQEQERKEGKTVICAAFSKSGNRCKTKVESGSSYCTIHAKVKQNKSGEKKQCRKIKSNKKRCKMQTSASSGYCYYHD